MNKQQVAKHTCSNPAVHKANHPNTTLSFSRTILKSEQAKCNHNADPLTKDLLCMDFGNNRQNLLVPKFWSAMVICEICDLDYQLANCQLGRFTSYSCAINTIFIHVITPHLLDLCKWHLYTYILILLPPSYWVTLMVTASGTYGL